MTLTRLLYTWETVRPSHAPTHTRSHNSLSLAHASPNPRRLFPSLVFLLPAEAGADSSLLLESRQGPPCAGCVLGTSVFVGSRCSAQAACYHGDPRASAVGASGVSGKAEISAFVCGRQESFWGTARPRECVPGARARLLFAGVSEGLPGLCSCHRASPTSRQEAEGPQLTGGGADWIRGGNQELGTAPGVRRWAREARQGAGAGRGSRGGERSSRRRMPLTAQRRGAPLSAWARHVLHRSRNSWGGRETGRAGLRSCLREQGRGT